MSNVKAVIYARFSSSAQREESIDTQIRECQVYAKKHGMTVINVYQDKAKSGRTANRPSFQRMIRDSESKTFDAVLLYTIDRFARNRFDAAYYKAKLKENGVKVYYAKQDLGDGPESILLESLMEGYAEYFSASLSRAVKAGQEENALNQKFAGGKHPYGYTVNEDRKYAIVEDEAVIIRRAFQQYADGMTKTEIANYLNSRGIRTRAGKRFRPEFFDKVFQNETYRGVYHYGTHRYENAVPRIISDKVWERCCLRRSESMKVRSKYKAKELYLLTPKLICGCCGAHMVGESGTSRNGTLYTYYKCIDKKKAHSQCPKRNEKKAELEDAVIGLIEEYILTPEMIREIAEECVQLIQKEMKEDPEKKMIEKQIEEINVALANGWKAVESGYSSPAFFERLNQYETEKKELQARLDVMSVNDIPLTVEDICLFLETIKKRPELFPDYRRFLCDTLINQVTVKDVGDQTLITIICNIEDRKKPEPQGSDYTSLVDWCTEHPNTVRISCHPLAVAIGGYYNRP